METMEIECLICVQEIGTYICSIGKCKHKYCFQCILNWLFCNFSCPMDRSVVTEFEIKDQSNGQVIFYEQDLVDFENLKAKILVNEDVTNKEFLKLLRKSQPALIWVGSAGNENSITMDDIEELFKDYGDIEQIVHRVNCCYIEFADLRNGRKMKSDLHFSVHHNQRLKIEEFDISTLQYIMSC